MVSSISSLSLLLATVATVRMKIYECQMAQSHGSVLKKWQKQATFYVANPPALHRQICQAEDRENLGHSVTLKRYAMQGMGPQSLQFAWLMHGGESHLWLPQLAMQWQEAVHNYVGCLTDNLASVERAKLSHSSSQILLYRYKYKPATVFSPRADSFMKYISIVLAILILCLGFGAGIIAAGMVFGEPIVKETLLFRHTAGLGSRMWSEADLAQISHPLCCPGPSWASWAIKQQLLILLRYGSRKLHWILSWENDFMQQCK